MVLYIPINSDMALYKDLGHFFIHESTLRFYVKCGCTEKGTYPFLSPRKREPTRIPMASFAWVFRPKNCMSQRPSQRKASDGNSPMEGSGQVDKYSIENAPLRNSNEYYMKLKFM